MITAWDAIGSLTVCVIALAFANYNQARALHGLQKTNEWLTELAVKSTHDGTETT